MKIVWSSDGYRYYTGRADLPPAERWRQSLYVQRQGGVARTVWLDGQLGEPYRWTGWNDALVVDGTWVEVPRIEAEREIAQAKLVAMLESMSMTRRGGE